MDKIRVLQIGGDDFREAYALPEGIDYHYDETGETFGQSAYEVVLLAAVPSDLVCQKLGMAARAYAFFVMEQVKIEGELGRLYASKCGRTIGAGELGSFLLDLRYFFQGAVDQQFGIRSLEIAQSFEGSIQIDGSYHMQLTGEYGDRYTQIAYWRDNLAIAKSEMMDLWLEYRTSEQLALVLVITSYSSGIEGRINGRFEFDENAMKEPIRIQAGEDSILHLSLFVRGSGSLDIISLHHRRSRGAYGYFLPGGMRYVTGRREEIFAYFEPGDRKPPFHIHFGNFSAGERFESVQRMRGYGSPFLMFEDTRLAGGAFYLGDEEYEKQICSVIESYCDLLHMSGKDIIMSGIAMGAYGALYYGTKFQPHALILGKPLANLGDMVFREKRLRPDGFAESLDVMLYHCGEISDEARIQLNERLWKEFSKADWDQSKFIVSYMMEDDYDDRAYQDLIAHITSEGCEIYGKGVHGRHQDNTGIVMSWFDRQLIQVLLEDYGREIR